MASTRLHLSSSPAGILLRLPPPWVGLGVFCLFGGAMLLLFSGQVAGYLAWLAESFQADNAPISDSRARSLGAGVQVWGWSGIILAAATLPLWYVPLRTRLVTNFFRIPERVGQPLPLAADRYGFPFFLSLASVLLFTLVAHWSLTAYEALDWFEGEDGISEWWSVATYLAAAVGLAATARILHGRTHVRLVWVQLLLAGLLLVGAMEEVSWGQRLFGWGTPGLLEQFNEQGETTLHNLGTVDTIISVLLFWCILVASAGSAVRAVWHHYGRVTTADFILPSLVLSPALLMILIWWVGDFWTPANLPRLLMDYLDYAPQGSEIPEVLLGLFLFLFALGNLRRALVLRRILG